jgi:hypothetical protein
MDENIFTKPELVVAVLDGWSASARREEDRISSIVREIVKYDAFEENILTKKSLLGMSRSRRFRNFILSKQGSDRSLLVVGKSLGARNIVEGVLNKLPERLNYRKTGLITIDPCWPTWKDFTPNLNKKILHLEHNMGRAVNIMAILPSDQQAGSMVRGSNVRNVQLYDYTHNSITMSRDVRVEIEFMEKWLMR